MNNKVCDYCKSNLNVKPEDKINLKRWHILYYYCSHCDKITKIKLYPSSEDLGIIKNNRY
jgi:hypothetical protein